MSLYDNIRKTVIGLSPCIHGARVTQSAEESGKKADELLDFSVNINPLGPPRLNKLLLKACKTITFYPDNRYKGFKKAAAVYLNVKPENIVPGNGSSELIRLFAETVIEPGDKVIIPFPTFSEYEFQCRLFGGEIEYINYSNITEFEPDSYKAVFLCNPNNPTANLLKREEVQKLARRCNDSEVFLVVDEAFIELSDPKESIAEFAASNDFVVVLRSLTKTYAIPGLRIGFAVASNNFAKILNDIRITWNLNSVALAVSEKLLINNSGYLNRSLELINKERKWLDSRLNSIRGFKTYHSEANFILVDIKEFFLNSSELTERMLGQGIIIRDCASFGLENHIRVAVRKRNENKKVIKAFSAVISQWGREIAEKELGRALEKGITARSRLNCEYYPCHFEGQDCTFCFCPFYPCEDKRAGGEFVQRSTGGEVWSCVGCRFIHDSEMADNILKALMEGKKIKTVWDVVMEPIL